MKPKILFYSDCPFFAGCENVLAILFNSRLIRDSFDVNFIYRANPDYEAGFKEAVPNPPEVSALALPDITRFCAECGRLPKPFGLLIASLAKIFCLKYAFVAVAYFRIRAKIKEVNPDILFVNNGGHPGAYSAIAAVLAGRNSGVGRIVYFVNNLAIGYDRFSRLQDWFLDRALSRGADVFAAGSHFSADRLAKVLGLHKEKVRNLYYGIDVRESGVSAADIRRSLKIPDGRPVVLSGGLLEKRKGHLFLLKAIKKIKGLLSPESVPFCVLAGIGSLQGELEGYIKDNDLSGDVALAGFAPNFYDLINICDAYVQPSIDGEDMPNVISMAMAYAKPVIGTRIAGIPEQILDAETGFIVAPGNHEMLADKILELISDPQKAGIMGRAGKARFEAMFTAKAVINAYVGLFNSLSRDPARSV